jgi:uncharacterized repeat protein (TIGR01451 family)
MARPSSGLGQARACLADRGATARALVRTVAAGVLVLVVSPGLASAQAPGGVAGSALWIKANQGVQANGASQVEQWLDQSGSGNTTTELRAAHPAHTNPIVASGDIQWVPGSINFNPAVDFSGALGRSLKANAATNWTIAPLSVFAVTLVEGPSGGSGAFGAVWDAHANWTTGAVGTAGAGLIYGTNRFSLDGNGCGVAFTTSSVTQPRVVRATYITGTNALGGSTWIDAGQEGTGTNCGNVVTTLFEVGGRTAGASTWDGRIFNGKIAEVVVFKSDLAAANDARVESYLALKYGITLRATGGTPHDYLTSAGATVWSGVANPVYHNAVAGIVADSGSAIDQRVSQSVTPGDQVAIAAGAFDFAGAITAQSPAAALGDQSALVWGDNSLSTVANVIVTDPGAQAAGVERRMARVWRTQATGSGLPSQVTIRIPATLVETSNPALRNVVLLVSTAADFSTVTRAPISLTKTGSVYLATFTTFTANEFFTIAGVVSFPDLSITKVAPAAIVAGSNATYALTVTNTSTVFANGAVISDTLPSSLTFVSSAPACSISGQTVTCALAAMPPGQSVPIALTVRVAPDLPAGTIVQNTASASTPTPDPTPLDNTSTVAAPPSTTSADVSTAKTAIESMVTPGDTFTYRIVATNNGPSTAVNVRATDPLPAQLAFVSSPSGCTAVGQNVSCGPTPAVPPGAAAIFDIVVRLDGTYTGDGSDIAGNVATATSDTPDPEGANNPSPAAPPPSVGAPQSDLQIVKHVSSDPVAPGANFTYTLQVRNNGPSTAVNVRVTDPLPVATAFVSSAAGCTAAPGGSGQLVSCPALTTLPVGGTATFDIVVQLNPAYTGDGADILNSGSVTSDVDDPQPQNNTNPAGAPPVGPAGADVTVVKTVSPGPVIPGETFTYTLLVSNQGPSVAAAVVVSDPLPGGVRFVSSAEGCTAAGQEVTCPTIATLNPGGSASFDLVVQLDPSYAGNGADLPNVAMVASATPDPVTANNTTPPVTPQVGPQSADLIVTKTVLNPAVSPGMLFTYRIVVSNAGPSAARTIEVTDTLPSSLTFASSTAPCAAVGQLVTCTLATLSPGADATFDLLVRLDPAYAGDGSNLLNTATAFSLTPDPNLTNNTSPAVPPTIGAGAADLTIAKAGPYARPASGGELAYTISVTNLGPNAALDVRVQDLLPTGLTFVANSGDCSTSFPCALGTLLPGQARTISARYVVSPGAPAVITNVASVASATPDPETANNSAAATTPTGALTYYFGEGATGTFWDNEVLIANPTDTAASVTMRFFRESGDVVTRLLTLDPLSHETVRVDDIPGLESAHFSASITSDIGVPLAVERTMSWDGSVRNGGHTETAVSRPATRWYFAEGSAGYFTTFVLLGNPGDTPVDVTVTFLREFQPPLVKTLTIGAHARYTVEATAIPELTGDNFGVVVDAAQPVVAERSMYFGTIPARIWSGGHSSAGVTEPARNWFFAEGATGAFFDSFILLSNPHTIPATVTLEHILTDGVVIPVTKIVPARGRVTVQIDFAADPRLHDAAVSTRVLSDVPIVAERSTYWSTKPDVATWGEGHNSFGLTETALHWALGEGRVGGPNRHHTYILLSNPWTMAAEVTLTYLRDNAAPIVKTYIVPPTTRYTVDVNVVVPELQNESFGARIDVTNGFTISVERSMYWDGGGVSWTAGTNAVGTKLP